MMQSVSTRPVGGRFFQFRPAGNATPAVIIFIALAVSAAVFFLFTRKHMGGDQQPGPLPAQPAVATSPDGAPAGPSQGPAAAVAPPDQAAAAAAAKKVAAEAAAKAAREQAAMTPPPPAFTFTEPVEVGTRLARSLRAGDYATAGKLASADDPAQSAEAAKVFEKIFKEMGYEVAVEQAQVIGLTGTATRLALPLTQTGGSNASLTLQLDVERDPKMGWKITQLQLPKELGSALNGTASATVATPAAPASMAVAKTPDGLPIPPPPGSPGASVSGAAAAPKKSLFVVQEHADALAFSSEFVETLLRHDFATARKSLDPQKVQPEKLAGLCIVFEEGQYSLKPSKPLIVTVANPEVSWVIAQVQSETLQTSTEFGLELQRSGTDQPWTVVGLNLSEILGSFAQSASKLGVPYTPIVQNPKGGESLALYFEYDRAELHPRALKQLEIVAGLLKADPAKHLNIAGHTDAMGADDYNIRLSKSRAEAVKEQLVALGVPAAQVETEALGKAQPLSPNQKPDGSDDPEGRSKNRRAEIYLDF